MLLLERSRSSLPKYENLDTRSKMASLAAHDFKIGSKIYRRYRFFLPFFPLSSDIEIVFLSATANG